MSLVAEALALGFFARGSRNWERARRSSVESLLILARTEEEEDDALESKRVSFATECTPP